jgi:tetratricopeptide (TPR) repeat protein
MSRRRSSSRSWGEHLVGDLDVTGPKRAEAVGKVPPRITSRAGSTAEHAAGGSTSLYERYKDALRRGHVAALRGRHDAAIDAYGEAASIAPDRALPHAGIGGILAKMNRPADAVAAYRRALDIAPRDETALRGIAEVLTRLGRRAEAAAALDRLAEGLDHAGRLPDATETARRALELAESRPRRTQVETFVARLRQAAAGDAEGELVIGAALKTLASAAAADPATADAVAGSEIAADAATAAEAARAGATTDSPADESPDRVGSEGAIEEPSVGPDLVAGAEVAIDTAAFAEGDVAATLDASVGPDLLPEPEASPPEPEPVEPAGLGIALGAVAEAQLHAGQLDEAREGLLAAARAHRRAGRLIAAVDACDLAIAVAPADPDLHLLLAELYLDRGWRALATDKLLLLGRIADLDGDRATRDRLCAIAATRLADEARLAELCA